jgi:hypothetical protein
MKMQRFGDSAKPYIGGFMRMIFVGLLLTVAVAVWAADKFQPLNIKPGLWETTATMTTTGGKPTTTTYKRCMTREDLQKTPKFVQNDKCTMTIIDSTSSKADVRMVCDTQGMKGSGTMHIEVLNPESVKATGQTTMNGSGYAMDVTTSYTSKWLGATCGNVGE